MEDRLKLGFGDKGTDAAPASNTEVLDARLHLSHLRRTITLLVYHTCMAKVPGESFIRKLLSMISAFNATR
jgi:hypothetical protein